MDYTQSDLTDLERSALKEMGTLDRNTFNILRAAVATAGTALADEAKKLDVTTDADERDALVLGGEMLSIVRILALFEKLESFVEANGQFN